MPSLKQIVDDPAYQKQLVDLERAARSKVSYTLSAIEVALADWEAAGRKPPALHPKMERLISYHGVLEDWERVSLTAPPNDTIDRILRLKLFVALCKRYEDV